MLFIAIRNLLKEKIRLVMSVGGVAVAILLMLTITGIYNGAIAQFTRYVVENPMDIVVSASGINDFFHGISLVAADDLTQIKNEEGVQDVVPMIVIRSDYEYATGKKIHALLVSFDPTKPQGAPWILREGTKDITRGQVIIAESIARRAQKKLGDSITFSQRDFQIVGIAGEAQSFSNHYVWMTQDEAQELLAVPTVVNFAFVTLDNPGDASARSQRLQEKFPHLSIVEKPTFRANNQAELEESFLPIIQAILVISLIIGITVVGLTIYTETIDKAREYGILKAIGVRNTQLYAIVSAQAIITVAAGLVSGIAGSLALAQGLQDWINVPPDIQVVHVALVVGAGVVMALCSALLPLRRITRIDPAEVFKS